MVEMNNVVDEAMDAVTAPGFFGRNKQMMTGLGIGLLVAVITNGAQYLWQRRRRQAIMQQIQLGFQAIQHNRLGGKDTPLIVGGKEVQDVEVANFIVEKNDDLHRVIHEFVLGGKLSRKEQEQWADILTRLTLVAQEVAIKQFQQEHVARDKAH